MPKTRSHRTKLAAGPNVSLLKAVTTKVDPKLASTWKKFLGTIEDAQSRGAEAFDELWEAVGAVVHHDPPLYVLGGYASASDLFRRLLHVDQRSATRNMLVAQYATPKEEETYGTSNLYAAILYIQAKLGPLGSSLPVAFDRLKIPVKTGATTKNIAFKDATFTEIEAATRALSGKKSGAASTDRTEKAIAEVLAKHPAFGGVRFTVQSGLVHVRGIPLASLELFARTLATVKLPATEGDAAMPARRRGEAVTKKSGKPAAK